MLVGRFNSADRSVATTTYFNAAICTFTTASDDKVGIELEKRSSVLAAD